MGKFKEIVILFIVLALTLSLIACAEKTEKIANPDVSSDGETNKNVNSKEGSNEKPLIAFCCNSSQNIYTAPGIEVLQAYCDEQGWELIITDANMDATTQAKQLDELIALKPDILEIMPVDSTALASGIKKAGEAGIPVLMEHMPANESERQYTVAYTGPDDYYEGQLAADAMHEALDGKGKIVQISVSAGQATAILRDQGFRDRLDELGSEIEILDTKPADSDKSKAVPVMEDFITRFGDEIDGVFAQSDGMASGAMIAIKESGMDIKNLKIVGNGASMEALQAIKDGELYATVGQSPIVCWEQTVVVMQKMIDEGVKPPNQLEPYEYIVEVPIVTKENVEDYMYLGW